MSAGTKTALARSLRQRQTEAEKRLWYHLRNRQLGGFKFRRQVSIDRFVVDFLCADEKLIVELDGSQHAENLAADDARTKVLMSCGYRIIRYWNADVLADTETVLEDILAHLEKWK